MKKSMLTLTAAMILAAKGTWAVDFEYNRYLKEAYKVHPAPVQQPEDDYEHYVADATYVEGNGSRPIGADVHDVEAVNGVYEPVIRYEREDVHSLEPAVRGMER